MWVRTRGGRGVLVNLDHVWRIFVASGPGEPGGGGTRWIVRADFGGQGQEVALAACDTMEEAERVEGYIEDGLSSGADYWNLQFG